MGAVSFLVAEALEATKKIKRTAGTETPKVGKPFASKPKLKANGITLNKKPHFFRNGILYC